MEKQLTERFKQIRILQRAQADKEARKERAARCQEEARLNACYLSTPSITPTGPGGAPPAPVRILRRPESSEKIREEKFQAQRAKAEEAARNQLTPEQKEALYVKARDRIMGPEYKPDNSQNAQNVAIVSRCKSPEQIRVPRFTDLPLAGGMSASHDVNIGGTIMMASMGSVTGVASVNTVGTPIVAAQQSTQQTPTSLLTMSSAPVGMPVQQTNAITQGLNQQVMAQQQTCMVSSPQSSKTIGAYPQYVIAQPQQHIPFSMTVGANQVS
uniref:SUZ domain-containing protein n=1 Tax=Angiostrongylus cantonensis TaxID=6313 RepID=A0A0K0D743_ANGCA